ncbi:MAG: DUF6263 family protein [Gemmatimonadaceae bacterium]
MRTLDKRVVWLGRVSWTRIAAGACLLALGTANAASAQRYSLQLRPRAGDTLRLKMEQTTEFEGTHGREKAPGSGGAGAAGKPDSTSHERSALRVYTRIAVEATDLDGADVTAITDSVRLTNSSGSRDAIAAAARAAEGRRVRLHVAPDGATKVVAPEGLATGALRSVVQMPATLPKEPVEVGQSWVRTMEIPVPPAGTGSSGGSAAISGTFKLDSVSRAGDIAYVSLTGRLVRSATVPYGAESNAGRGRSGRERAATVSTSGSITGSIVIDRTRGWIIDVRTSVVSRSLLQESGSTTASARMWMKISQWVQVY